MSHNPGIKNLPAPSMIRTSAGALIPIATSAILSPRIKTERFGSVTPRNTSITVTSRISKSG